MSATTWTAEDTARALQIWAEYKKQHDLSAFIGQTAGIDPVGARVWIGETAVDVARQMEAEGVHAPVYLIRVGFDYFMRKGRR